MGVEPEVGRSGIWDDGELLSWGTNADLNEVLGVHEVLDGDVLSCTEELVLEVVHLALEFLDGELCLDHWDLSGPGGSEHGGGSGCFHI